MNIITNISRVTDDPILQFLTLYAIVQFQLASENQDI